jgi:hypothetical protein
MGVKTIYALYLKVMILSLRESQRTSFYSYVGYEWQKQCKWQAGIANDSHIMLP